MRKIIFLISILFSAASHGAPVIPVKKLVKHKQAEYIKVNNRTTLHFKIFPIASSPGATWADPIIPETFVLRIPKGKIYSANGIVLVQDHLIKELIWPWSPLKKDPKSLDIKSLPTLKHIPGRIAVITQEGHGNYYHWMTEILPKLALLAQKNIQYDWLYVSNLRAPFMKETLTLMGVDPKKLLEGYPDTYIEADEVIVPSFVSRSCYTPKWVAEYIRKQFLSMAEQQVQHKAFLCKKIFISRQKASYRKIVNEDEVFAALELLGFKRYNLEDLSFVQQVMLFKHAEVIVAPHGAGLTNLLFCNPGTKVIELFQQHGDDTYWYLSQVLDLKHHCIKTVPFKKGGGYTDTIIPKLLIEEIVEACRS